METRKEVGKGILERKGYYQSSNAHGSQKRGNGNVQSVQDNQHGQPQNNNSDEGLQGSGGCCDEMDLLAIPAQTLDKDLVQEEISPQ